MRQLLLWTLSLFFLPLPAFAQDKDDKGPDKTPPDIQAEKLAEKAGKSIVVLYYTGRDGKQQGIGSGFVVGKDGLIATNFHVIGESRPITVQLADGSKHDVTEVYASDRHLDLAVVRIAAKGLAAPLPLGDSTKLKNGQPIVALGHPRGLEHSVVAGVLSGQRELDGVKMLQVAIPIEQGNSGGPVLDVQGQVVGVVTLKSLLTRNLGFAVPSNNLKKMLENPNPIPMERWLTIGALDKSEWKTIYGGRWRQRAGRITADGQGSGFGGRALCLYQRPVPKTPYEVSVQVKLDDEAGAAGLIVGCDERDRHYGFYPSGGKLRLTKFQGADVFAWKILQDQPSSHYRPGEWNTFKIRVEDKKLQCFVNDHLVYELDDPEYPGAGVGLAKFRETVAEFKRFQVAEKIAVSQAPAKLKELIDKTLAKLPQGSKDVPPEAIVPLVEHADVGVEALREQARQLEKRVLQLRQAAKALHHQRCLADLEKMFQKKEDAVDLGRAALIVARLDNDELDVAAYLREIDRLARDIQTTLPAKADEAARLKALNEALFKERGFHGSRHDYYARNNSYLNEVIDDREGLPITLSILYMELARRLDLKVVGVPLPGHFVVRHEPVKGKGQLVDVYEGGKLLSDQEAAERVKKITGQAPEEKDLAAASKKAIVARMLHNLINVAQGEKDAEGMLRYLDGILAVDPQAHEERWARAVFRFQAGRRDGSLADCEYLLRENPADVDLDRVRELKRLLQK